MVRSARHFFFDPIEVLVSAEFFLVRTPGGLDLKRAETKAPAFTSATRIVPHRK
jgi:hypothetical protein